MKKVLITLMIFVSQTTLANFDTDLQKELAAVAKAATHCGFLTSFRSEVEDLFPVGGVIPNNPTKIMCLKALASVDQEWLEEVLSLRDLTWMEENQDILLIEEPQSFIGRPELDFDIDEDDRPDFL